MTRLASVIGLAVLLMTSFTTSAHAQGVSSEVIVILAKEEPGEIDPTLQNIPALQRAPFSSFQSMEVLSRPRIRLVTGDAQVVPLPNGRRLQITLEQVLPDGRFRMRVSINRPDQRDYLPLLQVVASPGDPFFVAGQAYQGGTLVIGIRIGTR